MMNNKLVDYQLLEPGKVYKINHEHQNLKQGTLFMILNKIPSSYSLYKILLLESGKVLDFIQFLREYEEIVE